METGCEFCEQSQRDYNRVIEANKVFLRERDEAQAEVERAYRRGAEAMRASAERAVKELSHEDGIGMGSARMENAIRKLIVLDLPEDKP